MLFNHSLATAAAAAAAAAVSSWRNCVNAQDDCAVGEVKS